MEQKADAGAEARWSRAANVAAVYGETRVALLPLDNTPAGTPRVLEGAAVVIWRELAVTPRAEADIIARVAAAYEQAPAEIAEDVRGFLNELKLQGLARIQEA